MASLSENFAILTPARGDFIRRTLDDLWLPEPQEGEYTITEDNGALAMVTPAACVLRISLRHAIEIFRDEAWGYDHILQPIGRREGEGVVIDLYPGVHTPAARTVERRWDDHWNGQIGAAERDFGRRMCKDGYGFIYDGFHPFNFGFLPGTESQTWPQGFPVFLDPGDIRPNWREDVLARLRAATREVKELLDRSARGEAADFSASALPVQGPHFADLRQSFARAVAGGSADKEALWKDCMAAKKQGRLAAEWTGNVYKEEIFRYERMEELPGRSAAYERRLLRHPPFAAPAGAP